jgi:hypothetical protein
MERLLGVLPSLAMHVPAVADLAPASWHSGDITGTASTCFDIIATGLLWPARLAMLVLSVLFAGILYGWAKALFGPGRAWLPLARFAFCPPLLAINAVYFFDGVFLTPADYIARFQDLIESSAFV